MSFVPSNWRQCVRYPAKDQGIPCQTSVFSAPVSALTLLNRKRKSQNISCHRLDQTVQPRLFLLRAPHNENNTKSSSRDKRLNEDELQENDRGVFEIDLGITEIAGPGGTGKTQLCLGLCAACASATYEHATLTPPADVSPKNIASNNISSPASLGNGYERAGIKNRPKVRNPYASSSSNKSSPRAPSNVNVTGSHVEARNQTSTTSRSAVQNVPHKTRPNMPKSLYISMGEGSNPSQLAYRLRQIVDAQRNVASPIQFLPATDDVLSRILTRFIRNADEFSELVDITLPSMLANESKSSGEGRIGLVVLDSMAGLFRVPEDLQQNQKSIFYARRSQILFNSSAKLKKLSHEYGIPIVVVNQVTSSFSSFPSSMQQLCSKEMERIVPSMGLSWSNCVNTRFLLTRKETTEDCRGGINKPLTSPNHAFQRTGEAFTSPVANSSTSSLQKSRTRFVRHAHLILSPRMPFTTIEFTIDAGGGIAV